MPWSRDLLQRFRPAGTPGGASPAGVPADRVAELEAELEPVFALLAESQAEVARLRTEGDRDAERRRHDAVEEGRALVAAARRQAGADRADAALRATTAAEQHNAAALAEATRAAAATRLRASERMPSYVDQLTARMRSALRAGATG